MTKARVGTMTRSLLALPAALLALAVLCASAAQAKPIHKLDSSFDGTGTPAGAFADPGRMDIHEGDDLLYVLDPGNDAVLKYDISNPTSPVLEDFSALASPAITQFGSPPAPLGLFGGADVAVDDSGGPNDGTIYVGTGASSSVASDGRLLAFSATGEYLYELQNDGAAVNASNLDVVGSGDRAGDLIVYAALAFGASGKKVQHWIDQTGGAAPVYDEATSFDPTGFAFGEQRLAVADDGESIYTLPGITRYAADGTAVRQLTTDVPGAMTTDSSDGRLYAAGAVFLASVTGTAVSEYSGAGADEPDELLDSFGDTHVGLAVRSATSTVYAGDVTNHEVDVFVPGEAPDVTAAAPETTGPGEATFHGTVNPLGAPVTSCEFQYGTTAAYGQSAACEPADLGTGEEPVEVSADVSGLTVATNYHFRLRVTNADGENTTADATYFAPDVPVATTGVAGPTTRRGGTALLGGTVDANSSPTRWWIEYGEEADLSDAQSSPASEDLDAGDAADPEEFVHQVEGLAPATTYYFRVVAATDAGRSEGQIRSFTMQSQADPEPAECPNDEFRSPGSPGAHLPGCRAYERVTPADTAGGPAVIGYSIASVDGNRVTYASTAAYAGQQSMGIAAPYLAERQADGWQVEGIGPPAAWHPDSLYIGNWFPQAVTDDLEHFFILANDLNLPGAASPSLAHREADGEWQVLAPSTFSVTPPSDDGRYVFGGPEDVEVTEGLAPPESGGVFQTSADGSEIRLVSIYPDGTAITEPRRPAGQLASNPVSEDGSHIFMVSGSQNEHFWVRIDGTTTKEVSASELDPPEPALGKEWGSATPDGRYAFFLAREKLTTDSKATNFRRELYRFDTQSGDLEDLTTSDPSGADVRLLLGVSDDGSRAYFAANGNLTPDADGTDGKVYMWDATEGITLIADGVTGPDLNANIDSDRSQSRVSPDGRYLLFASATRTSVFDNASYRQYYRYDAETGRTDCVSCNPRGIPAAEDGYLQQEALHRDSPGITVQFGPRPRLTPDGKVVFATPDPLVRRDVNNDYDVYIWDGDPRLISTGRSVNGAWPTAMTEDASSIFFISQGRLVGADTNDIVDLYVARVNGGLAGQQDVPSEPTPCQGPACHGDPEGPPEETTPGTDQDPEGNPPAEEATADCTALEQRAQRLAKRGDRLQRKVRKLARRARRADGKRARRLNRRAAKVRRKARAVKREARASVERAGECNAEAGS